MNHIAFLILFAAVIAMVMAGPIENIGEQEEVIELPEDRQQRHWGGWGGWGVWGGHHHWGKL